MENPLNQYGNSKRCRHGEKRRNMTLTAASTHSGNGLDFTRSIQVFCSKRWWVSKQCNRFSHQSWIKTTCSVQAAALVETSWPLLSRANISKESKYSPEHLHRGKSPLWGASHEAKRKKIMKHMDSNCCTFWCVLFICRIISPIHQIVWHLYQKP